MHVLTASQGSWNSFSKLTTPLRILWGSITCQMPSRQKIQFKSAGQPAINIIGSRLHLYQCKRAARENSSEECRAAGHPTAERCENKALPMHWIVLLTGVRGTV